MRPWLVRLRCIGAVTARDLRETGDPTAAARASIGRRELDTLLEVTPGVGARVVAMELLLDLEGVTPLAPERLLGEGQALDPDRPDLLLAQGRLALRATPPRAEEVLEPWRRARRAEPLLRLPRGHVEDFERYLGPRPELAELVGEPR
ncbi:MAG: hypothetical protein KF878_11885 [Planctomycetes bacterium]|nr:hypothetical protein [Planctomycetota bacterium]